MAVGLAPIIGQPSWLAASQTAQNGQQYTKYNIPGSGSSLHTHSCGYAPAECAVFGDRPLGMNWPLSIDVASVLHTYHLPFTGSPWRAGTEG